MMRVIEVHNARTQKSVIVGDVDPDNLDKEAVVKFALAAARETAFSHFGTFIKRHGRDTVRVVIHTD